MKSACIRRGDVWGLDVDAVEGADEGVMDDGEFERSLGSRVSIGFGVR
jgi:hypothetical protein